MEMIYIKHNESYNKYISAATLAKLPEFAATVTAAPPTELAFAGTVPVNVFAVAFAL